MTSLFKFIKNLFKSIISFLFPDRINKEKLTKVKEPILNIDEVKEEENVSKNIESYLDEDKGTKCEEKKDNLKKIKGIGSAFEKRLNKQNIYTFEKLSNLSMDDVREIELKDNITSEVNWQSWIDQAKNLK
jgi:predicted flap endonuclease-1-like 5' DNA nuclease